MRSADAALMVLLLLVVWSFYRAQRDPATTFNLFDLVTEGGRVSKLACAFVGGVMVLSWIMIRLTLDGKMTEGYVGLYGGIVIAPVIAKLFSPPPGAGTVTTATSQTVTQTVGVPKGESA
jgi:hypothetical protein